MKGKTIWWHVAFGDIVGSWGGGNNKWRGQIAAIQANNDHDFGKSTCCGEREYLHTGEKVNQNSFGSYIGNDFKKVMGDEELWLSTSYFLSKKYNTCLIGYIVLLLFKTGNLKLNILWSSIICTKRFLT